MVLHLKDWTFHQKNQDFKYSKVFFFFFSFLHHKGIHWESVKCTVQPCIIFFFQNIVYPSVVGCCCCCCFLSYRILYTWCLHWDWVISWSLERRDKRREEEKGRKRRTEKEKLSSALSEDAVLRIVALFCPAPQSEGNNTEASLLCSKGMKLWVRFIGEIKVINGVGRSVKKHKAENNLCETVLWLGV